MKEQDLMAKWRKRGIILEGHFIYASGRHGSEYVEKKALRAYFSEWSKFCFEIAKEFSRQKVEVIIGPSQGGIAVALLVALHLEAYYGEKTIVLNADKDKRGGFYLNPTDKMLIKDKRVLVVDDVFNSGGSAKKVIALIRGHTKEIIGLGVVCNRGGDAIKTIGVPCYAVIDITLDSWSREECQTSGLCAQGILINTNYGHGGQ